MISLKFRMAAAALLGSSGMLASAATAAQSNIKIVLVNTGGVEVGSDAYEGFRTAAKFWEQHLTSSVPVTLRFDVGFGNLPGGALGGATSTLDAQAVADVKNRIAVLGSGAFDASVKTPVLVDSGFGPGTALQMKTPGYTGFDINGRPYGIDNTTSVYDTDGTLNNYGIALTQANGKALGYEYGQGSDANITVSSNYLFDFDPTDGIDAGSIDFVGLATHEMAHALGFASGLDSFDLFGTGGPLATSPGCGLAGGCQDLPVNDGVTGQVLDLFRYSAPGVLDWTLGTASYFSIDGGLTVYDGGLFSTGQFNGDGSQAGHWKGPQVPCTTSLGIMNPYICGGTNNVVTGLDFAALDAIGWNTNVDLSNFNLSTAGFSAYVPEPASWALMIAGFALIGIALRRRRSGYATA